MTKFNKNNYKFWHSPFALLFLFCILVFFGYKIIDLIEKEKETSRKKELILNQIDTLKKQNDSLLKDIAKLETEEGKEEVIRDKYLVAKEGEKMVTIVNEENNSDSLGEKGKMSHGFWNWFKRLFKRD